MQCIYQGLIYSFLILTNYFCNFALTKKKRECESKYNLFFFWFNALILCFMCTFRNMLRDAYSIVFESFSFFFVSFFMEFKITAYTNKN